MRSQWVSLVAGLATMVAVAACTQAPAQPTPMPVQPTAAPAAPAQPTAAPAAPAKPTAAPAAPAQPTAPPKPAAATPAGAAGPSQALIDAAKAEGEVVWLSGSSRTHQELAAQEFTKKYGIKVNWTRKGGPEVMAQVDAERRAGGVRVDVLSVGEAGTSRLWAEQGIITKYQPESVAFLIPGLQDPQGLYIPHITNLMVASYNTRNVKKEDLPKTWKDVADPRWRGRLASLRIRGTGGATGWAQVLYSVYGWSFFEDLAKIKPTLIASASGLPPIAVKGEADIVFPHPEDTTMPLIVAGEPLALLHATDVVPMGVGATMLVKDSRHPNAGKLLLDFLLRPEFQTQGVKVNGMRPSIVGAPAPEGLPPTEGLKLKAADTDWAAKNQGELWNKLDDIFGFQRTK